MQRDRTQNKYKYRKVVGPYGDFTNIKSAVDWFNASAIADTELVVESGDFPITDTVTVNNSSHVLQIRGADATFFNASTGLTNKPMFIVKTPCDFRTCYFDGTTLASYGTLSTEDAISLDTVGGYIEVVDCEIHGFYHGVYDTIGTDFFMFNFVVGECTTGVRVNYTVDPGAEVSADIEVGNFVACTTGIYLDHAYLSSFMLAHLIFYQEASPAATAIVYDGTNFHYGTVSNIFNCTYNNVGTFRSGFDFSLASGRDANVEMLANVGTEDKNPHAKVNVVDSTATTAMAAANTYYKLNFNSKKMINFNVAATSGNFTITIGDQTTASIAWNASAATIQTAINNLSNVTSVTVTQVVAAQTWTIEFNTTGEGWLGMMPVVNLDTLSPTTSADVTPDTYSCKFGITNNKVTLLTEHKQDLVVWITGAVTVDANSRNINLGVKLNALGMPLGPMTVRVVTSGQPTAFASIIYLDGVVKNDYFELYASSTNAGDVVTLSDLALFVQSQ